MPLVLPALSCTPEQHEMLTSLARGKKIQARLKERARIVLRGIDGVGIKDTARQMGLDKGTVYLWQCRFLTSSVADLEDSAHRRHLSGAQAPLVCQPGPRLRHQGGRCGGAVPVSTGKRYRVQCG